MLKKMMKGFIKIKETVVPLETFVSLVTRHLKADNLVCDGVLASTINHNRIEFTDRQRTNSFQARVNNEDWPSGKSRLIHPMDLVSSKRRMK